MVLFVAYLLTFNVNIPEDNNGIIPSRQKLLRLRSIHDWLHSISSQTSWLLFSQSSKTHLYRVGKKK